ncbi:MAG: chromate transporter [Ruminococcaceae bacterium]|nr:chromate transporter [Oscillospiraceae bacterium]
MVFLTLFLTFFKIGAFTFGGGYAMLPFIQQEVLGHNWVAESDLINFIAISESTPGPFAINMATYVGSQVGNDYGWLGSIFGSFCATMGVVLPSFLVILVVAKFYEKYKQSTLVKGCMSGLKPAVVGLIAAAILSVVGEVLFPAGVALSVFQSPNFYVALGIFALTCTLAFWKKVHPIILIVLSAGLGIAWGYLAPTLGTAIPLK